MITDNTIVEFSLTEPSHKGLPQVTHSMKMQGEEFLTWKQVIRGVTTTLQASGFFVTADEFTEVMVVHRADLGSHHTPLKDKLEAAIEEL